MNPITIDPRVLRVVGPVPALVHAILADTESGLELAYSQIADIANISISSARRAVGKLLQEGLIASEPSVEELYGQRANRYRILEPASPPVQYEQPYMSTDITNTEDSQSSNSVDYQSDIGRQGNRDAGSEDGPKGRLPLSWCFIRAWTPINSPMPPPANSNLFKHCKERLWLVSYMEAYVVDRENQERCRKGWKLVDGLPDKRRLQFLRDAEKLLDENPLRLVVEVIDWVFINHGGWLPFDVIDPLGMKRKDGERKVTSLRNGHDSLNWPQ